MSFDADSDTFVLGAKNVRGTTALLLCALLFSPTDCGGGDDSRSEDSSTAGSGTGAGAGTDASTDTGGGAGTGGGTDTGGGAGVAAGTSTGGGPPISIPTDLQCAEGFTCYVGADSDVVWVMKDDGNVNGPNCKQVCENALSQNCVFMACDELRPIVHTDMASFAEVASGLGFTCREGGCWGSEAPGEGMLMVSIATDPDGSKACYFPTEATYSCSNNPGNANCFGERYSTVCPCVPKALDEACEWECPPNHTTRAVWKTEGTSCVERINYWRKRACEEGWVECPPAGLPPMVECTACHECANSQAEWDADNGAHASFTRCGELVQGEGGGATCADVIDSFVRERAPDDQGVMRCQGHCGPIVAPGCQTFFWGKDRDSDFHTLNWRSCNVEVCQGYCNDNPGDCFTVDTSPPATCDDPGVGAEAGPDMTCP